MVTAGRALATIVAGPAGGQGEARGVLATAAETALQPRAVLAELADVWNVAPARVHPE